ncbi:regulatory protein SipA [Synechocystis sp. LKSZ1]|uniref:regulatory protein SipA n=1 Tax=Synechocystis sp. LKSZ1 TaxID=3144951 RepID=UPI00336BFBB6
MSEIPLSVGSNVRLIARPTYFKTADPMPMLRPPDLVGIGEEGRVLERRPAGYWSIRFERGVFLVESQYLEVLTTEPNALA